MAGAQALSTHGVRQGVPTYRNGRADTSLLTEAVDRATALLLGRQAPDGHWVGELQGDTILESEWILLMAFLGRENDHAVAKAARYILSQQQDGGGWSNYPDGPPDVSVSAKAYFALKLAGYDPDAPPMRRAREVILGLGGAAACNSFTKFYFAFLGQFPYANCPAVPPEMMFLPRWAYFNIYAVSSWTRTIIVPLSIFYAHKPVRSLPENLGIRELFLEPPETPLPPHPPTKNWFSWTNIFLAVDRWVKWWERVGLGAIRKAALRRAWDWMTARFADSDGLGAIFPPMIYTVVCLKCQGYSDDSPEMQKALQQLEELMIEEGDTIRLQPCFSPVWDTALTLNALADVAYPGFQGEGTSTPDTLRPAIEKATRWLLDREVRQPGDWSEVNPRLEPSGWFFEYRNRFYPDTDDTAMVLMALARTGQARPPRGRCASERALQWLRGMQNRDGGWAAFDRDINRQILTKVPFADHNAMLDPSCPDITARVMEALGAFGARGDDPPIQRGLMFLERTQEPFGAWPGRWGVNYIYGTWQVLVGLASIEYDMSQSMVRRAVDWLLSVQQSCGGWGESCRSYDDPAYAGRGTPTASQTAWALLALLAAGEGRNDAVRHGIEFLLANQNADGGWTEEQFTGTGFPKVFYLKYHMYSLYFPLMALARYQRAVGALPRALPKLKLVADV